MRPDAALRRPGTTRARSSRGGPSGCRIPTSDLPTPRTRPHDRTRELAAAVIAAVAFGIAATGCGADGSDGTRPFATSPPATTAPARTPTAATAPARALRAAEALVGLDARRLGLTLALHDPRPGVAARLDHTTATVTLFASGAEAPHRLAHDLAHELGHAVDLDALAAADRRAYLARRGRPGATWWPAATTASDYATGAGDFAEVFALCHAASPVFRSRLAPRPVDACALLPPAASSYAARASKDIG
jgi:hypothetical protein